MLELVVPASELFDETVGFIQTKQTVLQLEHSLISISKWESKWKKPYLSDKEKTNEEILDYIKCMTLTKDVDQNVYFVIASNVQLLKTIANYIDDSMTATTFSDKNKKFSREIITSEIIYYWMISFNIPTEYSKWHLNRLLALIKVCGLKNSTPEKMSKMDQAKFNHNLNASRLKHPRK